MFDRRDMNVSLNSSQTGKVCLFWNQLYIKPFFWYCTFKAIESLNIYIW